MPYIHLLVFKPPPLWPPEAGHWALYLHFQQGSWEGTVFGVQKKGLITRQTMLSRELVTAEIYSEVSRFVPLNIEVEEYYLSEACQSVTANRPFHIKTANCQHWVCEVIEKLMETLDLPKAKDELERIKKEGHKLGEG